MLVCLALGVVASLAYGVTPKRLMLPFMVSSFCVVVVQPVVMVAGGGRMAANARMGLLVVYAFHMAASIVVVVQFLGESRVWKYNAVEVVLLLALGSCFLMGAAAVLGEAGAETSDVESTATACLEQLLLNKAHEKPGHDVANKASQKTLVQELKETREASGSTLHSDSHETEPEMVTKAMASNSLDDYCLLNWMSPSLGHYPLVPALHSLESLGDVQRSKLVSQLHVNKRLPKKRKWQLIHDEKVFLQSVNENLLPSVLKQGVSPIQESKSRFLLDTVRPGEENTRNSIDTERRSSVGGKVSFDKNRTSVSEAFPDIMEGLEEIPLSTPPPWAQNQPSSGLRQISLQDWEQNKEQWLQQQYMSKLTTMNTEIEQNRPQSYILALASAPSLHTYRRNLEGSVCNNRRLLLAQELFENVLTHCVTPTARVPELPIIQLTNSSPIKKVMGMFRRRGLEAAEFAGANYSFAYGPPPAGPQSQSHKHLDSVANSMNSHPVSLASGKSSRSGLPRKAIKSFLLGHLLLHKSGSSFTYTPNNPPPVPPAPPPIPILFNMPKDPLFRHSTELLQPFRIPSDEWEMSEATALDQSRVSSLPSAIIGEYDKEKWRKLKELEQRQEAEAIAEQAAE